MGHLDTNSIFLLIAILGPLATGVVLLFGARFNRITLRAIAAFGFSCPLIIGLLLYSLFEPSLVGEYNFELRLPTGLEDACPFKQPSRGMVKMAAGSNRP